MAAPTVAVRIRLCSQDGVPYEDTRVTARLNKNDVYQPVGEGAFVISDPASGLTDEDGEVTLDLFPNNPETGLGTTGSIYRFSAQPRGGRAWSATAQIPNMDCDLEDVVDLEAVADLTAAEAAEAHAQASSAEAEASALEAAASADAAAASAMAAASSATAAAASAASAATSAAAASASATAAAASAAAAAASATAADESADAAAAALAAMRARFVREADWETQVVEEMATYVHPASDTTPRTCTLNNVHTVTNGVVYFTIVNELGAGVVTITPESPGVLTDAQNGAQGSMVIGSPGIATVALSSNGQWICTGANVA